MPTAATLASAVMDSDHPCVVMRLREAGCDARAAAKAPCELGALFNLEMETRNTLAAVQAYARCERLTLKPAEALTAAALIAERGAA